MARVLIVGAGGHGQVVAEILLLCREAGSAGQPIGYVDDTPGLAGRMVLGLPVLGTLASLGQHEHDAMVVAIGDIAARARIFAAFETLGERFHNAVHPSASVSPSAQLGRGVMICATAVVGTAVWLGDNIIVNSNASVDHHSRIGSHAHIAPGAIIGGNGRIGSGAFIGLGAKVLPGISIGEGAIIGAGAVVTRDVPGNSTSIGVPARVVRRLDG